LERGNPRRTGEVTTASPPGGFVELDSVTRWYEGAPSAAVSDLTLEIARGEIFALLGPSGCGKSTTLRLIAGLERPDRGQVRLGGETITHWPPERRRMGVVFQSYALFPHLNVAENVGFGLKARRAPAGEVAKAVREALELVQLTGLEQRSVDQLSGGQQQRVALARALALAPDVLLLDEPLSNLDAALREETRNTLRALLRRLGMTVLFVTHDQSDALAFADRIGLMRAGGLVEVGTPEGLYNEPATVFTATFLGGANVFRATAVGDGRSVTINTDDGQTAPHLEVGSWVEGLASAPAGAPVSVVARPERLTVSDDPTGKALPARVLDKLFLGPVVRLTVRLDAGVELRALVPRAPRGERAWIDLGPNVLRALPASE
jgi:putative spermidine/putrescine transport system ATP-binding protein